jgi:hypothetical protein
MFRFESIARSSCVPWTLAFVAQAALASTGAALSPTGIFERAGESVTMVQAQAADGTALAAATAIALGDGRYVSTCAALEGSDSIRIGPADRQRVATLLARDVQRNLCLLSARAEADPAAISRAPAGELPPVGERVYALSNALGLGIGLSEGVIAGMRQRGDVTLLQFTAPISPGSEGGALVDSKGRLVGIIDYRQRDGQNVNFAAPVDWIDEIEMRSRQDAHRQEWRDRAARWLREGDGEKLAELAGEWTRRHPDEFDGWALLASGARLRRDFVAEEQAWRGAQERDPQSVIAAFSASRLRCFASNASPMRAMPHRRCSPRVRRTRRSGRCWVGRNTAPGTPSAPSRRIARRCRWIPGISPRTTA